MERPAYLSMSDVQGTGRVGSAATVVALHVAAVFGLLAAFNPGAVMNEIRIIQASIEAPQEIARTPPPAPKDFVKPTPPVAILPVFNVQDAAPPPPSITTVPTRPQTAPAIMAAPSAPVPFTRAVAAAFRHGRGLALGFTQVGTFATILLD